jgi:ankyrin repeat protein
VGETALSIAVAAGHEHIVEKLVDVMSVEELGILDIYGNTPLVGALNAGNYRMTACMLRKNNNLVSIEDEDKRIPVIQAIGNGDIELARYLYSLTPLEDLTKENGAHGATLCTCAIYTRSLGKNQLF